MQKHKPHNDSPAGTLQMNNLERAVMCIFRTSQDTFLKVDCCLQSPRKCTGAQSSPGLHRGSFLSATRLRASELKVYVPSCIWLRASELKV